MSNVLVLDRDETLKLALRDKLEAKGITVIDRLGFARECEIAELLAPSETATACITSCRIQGCEIAKKVNLVAAVVNLSQFSHDGLTIVRRMKHLWPEAAVIAMVEPNDTALLRNILDIIQQGAVDFLVKPVSEYHVERIIDQARLGLLPSSLKGESVQTFNECPLVGHCDAMKSLYTQLLQIGRMEKVSGRVRSVLITGETGTGKQLVARALHATGLRPRGPFVEVNCAAIPAPLLEAELFGYEKGAFTDAKAAKPGLFEAADGGTLFLDEICSMDISVQAKILKAIEDKCIRRIGGLHSKSVNVRIIAASNKTSLVEIGQSLRQDLYYRLASFTVAVPPLRDRGEDILTLAHFFLERIAKEWDGMVKRLMPEAQRLLLSHAWPGNVRELMHVMDRAASLTMRQTISHLDLKLVMQYMPSCVSISKNSRVEIDFGPEGINLEDVERQIILKALMRAQWKRAEAARLLGISKETLRYRIEKFRLSPAALASTELGVPELTIPEFETATTLH